MFRQPHGPGWALVGDAGYHKDPILALGISDAFRDADSLANAVDAGLQGREPMHAALAQYQRERDAESAPAFQMTLDLARLAPPPEQMQAVVRGAPPQPATDRSLLRHVRWNGADPEFFAPDNLASILGPIAA